MYIAICNHTMYTQYPPYFDALSENTMHIVRDLQNVNTSLMCLLSSSSGTQFRSLKGRFLDGLQIKCGIKCVTPLFSRWVVCH